MCVKGDDNEELMTVFGLDPKLYGEKEKEEKFPENHLGRVFFNLRLGTFSEWFVFTFCGGRYDKISESLALRILNIKNIPRNNKDVSFVSED